MKSYLITNSEYKNRISPLFKEYKKFLKNNNKYFAKSISYNSIKYHTFYSFLEESQVMAYSLLKKEYGENIPFKLFETCSINHIKKQWEDSGGVVDDIPQKIKTQYNNFIESFIFYFYDINDVRLSESNSNKKSIMRAIDNGIYYQLLNDASITVDKIEKIFNSVSLKVPKYISNFCSDIEIDLYSIISHKMKVEINNSSFLKNKKEEEINNIVSAFINSTFSIEDYCQGISNKVNYIDKVVFLCKFIDNKTLNVKEDYKVILEIECNKYINYFTHKFVDIIYDKISILDGRIKYKDVQIIINIDKFGNFIIDINVLYNNLDIKNKVRILFSNNYTKKGLCEKYLTSLYSDDKEISLKKLYSLI